MVETTSGEAVIMPAATLPRWCKVWPAAVLAVLCCDESIDSTSGGARIQWGVDLTPTVTIGTVDGDSSQTFGRVAGALLLGDGRVVVADGLSQEVKWFGSDGQLLGQAGGKGDGPGEFRRIQSVQRLRGDSVVIFDGSAARLSIFDSHMNLTTTITLARGGGSSAFRLENGSVLSLRAIAPSWGNPPRTGLHREPVDVLWHAPDGSFLSEEGTYPGVDVYVVWDADPRRRILGVHPAARWTHLGVKGNRYVVATGDEGSLAVVNAVTRDTIKVALDSTGLSLTPDLIELYAGTLPPEVQMPRIRPPYSRIVLEQEWLWVASFAVPPDVPSEWTAYSLSGEGSRTVRLPPGLDLRDMASDRILGVRTDNLGVEYVQLHTLRRGESKRQ